MTADTRVRTPLLLSRLLDDAAIFPPGNAPMSQALRQHASYEKAWYAGIVGPFLCTDVRLPELVASLPDDAPAPLDLTLVVPGGVGALEVAARAVLDEPRLTLHAVDLPTSVGDLPSTLATLDELSLDVPTYLELPLSCALEPLQGSQHRAKFRTGGVHAGSVPTNELLAMALTEAVSRGVPFKLTAGLHRAAAGEGRHGFLNVLLAVHAALDEQPVEDVAAVLGLRDDALLARRVHGMTVADSRHIRQLFVSFGTCSIGEPLSDLLVLGLLTPAGA